MIKNDGIKVEIEESDMRWALIEVLDESEHKRFATVEDFREKVQKHFEELMYRRNLAKFEENEYELVVYKVTLAKFNDGNNTGFDYELGVSLTWNNGHEYIDGSVWYLRDMTDQLYITEYIVES